MIQDAELTRIVPICTFQAHKDYLTRLLLSPDVKHLATCSADHTAKVWNLDLDYPPAKRAAESAAKVTNRTVTNTTTRADNSDDDADADAASTNAKQNGASSEGDLERARNRDLSSLALGVTLPTPPPEPQASFPVQPDGPPMDPETGTLFLETTLSNHQRWVWDCAFSADSAYLVTVSSDHYARLWELASGQIIRQYSGHHRGAVCVALNDYSEPR